MKFGDVYIGVRAQCLEAQIQSLGVRLSEADTKKVYDAVVRTRFSDEELQLVEDYRFAKIRKAAETARRERIAELEAALAKLKSEDNHA